MNFNRSPRRKIGPALLVFCALLSSMRLLYGHIAGYRPPGLDFASDKVRRYQKMKEMLPEHGMVGYISNVRSKNMFDNNAPMAGYFAAQYTLAPVVLAYTRDAEIVIGDFPGKKETAQFYMGLLPLKDFGNGLLLLGRDVK